MCTGQPSFRSTPVLLAGLLVVFGLLVPACGGDSTPSLNDVDYWRVQFSKGQSMDIVVNQGSSAVPLLRRLLGDSNRGIVQTAATVAQQIGEPAAATMPALLDALERFPKHPFILAAIKAMKGSAVPYLLPMLDSSTEPVKTVGVELLNGIGAEAAPAIEPLMKIVEGSASRNLKRSALVTLGSIGTPAEPVVMRINEFALANDDLRQDAAMAMKRIRTAKKVREKGGNR